MSLNIIIFDFNRTLFDPDQRRLLPGAVELLETARDRGYRLVLLAQAAPSRRRLIQELGLAGFFTEIILVPHKSVDLFRGVAERHQADLNHSFVIGDRAQGEIKLGYLTGWRTVWFRQGKFANEAPDEPAWAHYTVESLVRIIPLL